MNHHEIKIRKEHYENVKSGTKPFEIRVNDRAYQKGDKVSMQPVNETGQFILGAPVITYRVGDVYPIDAERVVFGLVKIEHETI